MIYGYVKVQKNATNRELAEKKQAELFQKLGVEKIIIETDGSELNKLLEVLQPNDSLHILSIDRLARDADRCIEIVKYFSENNIRLYASGEFVSMEPYNLALIEGSYSTGKKQAQDIKSCIENMHNQRKCK